jgi:hypothetical protein
MAKFRQIARAVGAGPLGLKRCQGVARRAAPEGERPARQAPVDLRGHAKAIIGVVRLIRDHLVDLGPHGAPGLVPGQLEPRGEPPGKAKGEIEAQKRALAVLGPVIQDVADQGLGLFPRRGIMRLEGEPKTHVALQNADPDGVGPGGGFGGRAPVDHDIGIE